MNRENNFFNQIIVKDDDLKDYNNLQTQSSNLNFSKQSISLNNNFTNNDKNINSDTNDLNLNYINDAENKNTETNVSVEFNNGKNKFNKIICNGADNSLNINTGTYNKNITFDRNFKYSNLNDQDFSLSARKYGNTFIFLNIKKGPIFVLGPNWCYFLGLTLVLFLTFIGVFLSLGDKLNYYVRIIGIFIYSVQFISYSACSLINPGLPDNRFLENPNFKFDNKVLQPCSECKLLNDLNTTEITYHCFECEVCIEGYDHHCPWISKCVGKNNIWLFYIFVGSTFIYIIFLFVALSTIS